MNHRFGANLTRRAWKVVPVLVVFFVSLTMSTAFAQETTGGLQGTVKDSTGAVVAKAHVELTGTSLVGTKSLDTDSSGYFRFANLPPGNYTLKITAQGFQAVRRDAIPIEVGHLPTLDIQLQVGASSTVVEVTGEAPLIDTTTSRTVTNITPDVVLDVPHGTSFQSVIQFAPSARNEPLMGNNVVAGTGAGGAVHGGTGGGSAGNTSNGGGFGFQVGGGSDSENKYLVEGQDTANLAGGYSHTDVPFEFIDQVEIKSSGIEAEHGGALGGVVNVIMKHGSNNWHGSLSAQYQSDIFDANQNTPFVRYDPKGAIDTTTNADAAAQIYLQKPNHFRYVQPGFTIGGPILKDRVWVFLGFDPKYTSTGTTVNFGTVVGSKPGAVGSLGPTTFTQDQQTYFTSGRVDASVSQKIRVFTSWLYQYQRESGVLVPYGDSTTGLENASAENPLTNYEHNIGFAAPNQTVNIGLDYAVTPKVVATARFGYFFANYHDFGLPTTGTLFNWLTDGSNLGTIGNGDLKQVSGFFSGPTNPNFTTVNADKHHQLDLDVAWFKGSRFGTHNLKFGYQLNHIANVVGQHYNEPLVTLNVGDSTNKLAPAQYYDPLSTVGANNCAALVAMAGSGNVADPAHAGGCGGKYGWVNLLDFGTGGKASNYNHGFFAQDSWTIGHGVTIDAGVRLEKEYVPAEVTTNGFPSKPINFGWGDKIAPRFGAAWDVFRDGRMKVFGSYGVFNDVMKLNLAISSFGGQYWNNCYYTLNTADLSTISVVFNNATPQRYCSGSVSTGGNFAGGTAPAGLGFIENQNQRTNEGAIKGIKPYRQHESVFGVDYAIMKNLAFEARWDRRRLDYVIEDAAIATNTGAENFLIVNPGRGVASTFDGYYQTLYGTSSGCTATTTPACPNMIPAARSYDGLELRLTRAASAHWFGMFSYTYSNLRGNYSGLTSSDIADGGGGRNAPNNSRSFDEPFFQWDSYGKSSSGPLGTDRPNAFKGFAYYRIPWLGGKTSTNIGWFQTLYSGTPKNSYVDVGAAFNANPFSGGFPVYPEGRGKWANISEVPNASGVLIPTVTSVCDCRTPWYIQSDASLRQEFKIGKNEAQVLAFEANVTNLFNRRQVTAYYSQVDTGFAANSIQPGGLPLFTSGPTAYSAYEHTYNWKALLGNFNGQAGGVPITGNSQYGLPLYWQTGRSMRLAVRYTF